MFQVIHGFLDYCSFEILSHCWWQITSKGDPLFDTAKYTVYCANRFFRILRKSGIFIYGSWRQAALDAGMDMNDTCLICWPHFFWYNLCWLIFKCWKTENLIFITEWPDYLGRVFSPGNYVLSKAMVPLQVQTQISSWLPYCQGTKERWHSSSQPQLFHDSLGMFSDLGFAFIVNDVLSIWVFWGIHLPWLPLAQVGVAGRMKIISVGAHVFRDLAILC